MSHAYFALVTTVLFFFNGALATPTSSNCEKPSCGNHQYTWNFVLPGGHGIQAKALADMTNLTGSHTTHAAHHLSDTSIDNHGTTQQKCPECPKYGPGIYWRQWTGKIPHDAIIGGHFANTSGPVPIYMAQAYLVHKELAGLQPGQIFSDSTSLTVVFKGVHTVSSNVKILCGTQEEVVWLPYTQTAGLNPVTDFVNAGFEKNVDLYFAKAVYGGKQLVGKFILQNKLMYLAYNGRESALRNFDVLCYRASLVQKNIKIPSLESN